MEVAEPGLKLLSIWIIVMNRLEHKLFNSNPKIHFHMDDYLLLLLWIIYLELDEIYMVKFLGPMEINYKPVCSCKYRFQTSIALISL